MPIKIKSNTASAELKVASIQISSTRAIYSQLLFLSTRTFAHCICSPVWRHHVKNSRAMHVELKGQTASPYHQILCSFLFVSFSKTIIRGSDDKVTVTAVSSLEAMNAGDSVVLNTPCWLSWWQSFFSSVVNYEYSVDGGKTKITPNLWNY